MNTRDETDAMQDTQPLTIAFVCVQNAGRSQMATAFAERELETRDLDAAIDVVTGGTRPAETVHEVVVDAMAELNVDISDRTPRAVTTEELSASEYVITMGCDAEDVCPAGFGGVNRDWELTDPAGKPIETVREIRDEIADRVESLFDEILTSRADR